MRALITATLLSMALTVAAFADESVAGHWKSSVGSGVTIDMQITPDGKWSSETSQGNKMVRRMEGTYTQTPPSGNHSGKMVFSPTSASASNEAVETETDRYTLSKNGQVMRLTSGGDTMVFQKLAQ